ncbi:glycosyltransferase family 2 protein [Synechococcus sp. RSCCF101]|uniref:glycosyltransferase n=1 Tax=Synechococcus sp. RSCCF101 TaxID=2511069 RepID=UPI0012471E00|nr:glycosyltransferase family 2 protein [Synechococcus sp. RSCCF101]QEY33531.1 glycosyltransferase family 2 protein [Synechococcus sp. RSCCF101]
MAPSDPGVGTRVSIVLPTYNERANVAPIVEALAYLRRRWQLELIFVDDDSSDGTADLVRRIAHDDDRVRLVLRLGRSGLAGAIKEGLLNASGDWLVVMDCDGQHEPAAVEQALDALIRGGPESAAPDLVVGSRFHPRASLQGLSRQRQANSRLANRAARWTLPAYSGVSDAMSGFFALRPSLLPLVRRVDVQGFKFLYELLAVSGGRLRVEEIPLQFAPRQEGVSKLDNAVVWDLAVSMVHSLCLRLIPRRAVSFGLVGLSGVAVHLLIFGLVYGQVQQSGQSSVHGAFLTAQISAVIAAASSNYLINNALTFRRLRLKGRGLLIGLLKFLLVSSLGMIANISVASVVFERFSGAALLALLAGITVDFVWKYAASSRFVWHQP